MSEKDTLLWFKQILAAFDAIPTKQYDHYKAGNVAYNDAAARAWVSEAEVALASAFPSSHPLHHTWSRLEKNMRPSDVHGGTLEQMYGTFRTATKIIEDGRLRGLIDGVRAETVVEVLDQAATYLNAEHIVAATVLAGGALETHLKHLIDRNRISVAGDGSISRYNDAIAQERKKGTAEVYSAADGKQVTAWGGLRNDAVHTPLKFSHDRGKIQLMIDGIRHFISKTTS
jgi:hypothetical protein